MFSKILSYIPARYKFGVTATPSREDGMIDCMYAYLGCNMNGEFDGTFKIDRSKVKTMEAEHIMYPLNNGYDKDSLWEIVDADFKQLNKYQISCGEDKNR
jgi:superfamily II DNA or RNA helicase